MTWTRCFSPYALLAVFSVLMQINYWTSFSDSCLKLPDVKNSLGSITTTATTTGDDAAASSFPACTHADGHRYRPNWVTPKRYREVETEGKAILDYIVTTLHQYDVPVVLLFGTALREHRDGYGPCVQPSFKDDDFDIGVLRQHFHYVVLMLDDIRAGFGWHTVYGDVVDRNLPGMNAERNFLTLIPPRSKLKQAFQIDIYGLNVNHPREGLVDLPWDRQVHDARFYFPLRKHKPVSRDPPPGGGGNISAADGSVPFYHLPFDMDCYLTNLYGPEYMTPSDTKSDGYRSNLTKVGHPRCTKELSETDRAELERQMSLLNKTYGFTGAAGYIFRNNTQRARPLERYGDEILTVPKRRRR